MIERIAALLLLRRPLLRLPLSLARLSSAFAARVSGEQLELLAPLMGTLVAAKLFGIALFCSGPVLHAAGVLHAFKTSTASGSV